MQDNVKPLEILSWYIIYAIALLGLALAILFVQEVDDANIYIISVMLLLSVTLFLINKKKIRRAFQKKVLGKKTSSRSRSRSGSRDTRRSDIDWNSTATRLKRRPD